MKSSFHNTREITKTRKEHCCWGCCELIAVGSSCLYIAQVWEGDFVTWYQCESCMAYLKTPDGEGFWDRYSDGASDGAIAEDRQEMESRKHRYWPLSRRCAYFDEEPCDCGGVAEKAVKA